MELVFGLIIFFSAIVVIAYLVVLHWIYIPIRSFKMQILARKYKLNYIRKENISPWYYFFNRISKRNILSGKIGDKNIIIYDYNTISTWKDYFIAGGIDANSSKKITYINGISCQGFLFHYFPVKKIEKYIEGKIEIGDSLKISFNKGTFLLVFLLGLVLSLLFYYYFLEVFNIVSIYFSIFTIILLFTIIAFFLAKKSSYNWYIK
jgi:hypothetical protein